MCLQGRQHAPLQAHTQRQRQPAAPAGTGCSPRRRSRQRAPAPFTPAPSPYPYPCPQVDKGVVDLPGTDGETETQGIDDLGKR